MWDLRSGGVLGILVYVVGIPAFFVSILYRGVKHRLFDTQHYRNQYGWLFMRFESEYYFWELTFGCRRLATENRAEKIGLQQTGDQLL